MQRRFRCPICGKISRELGATCIKCIQCGLKDIKRHPKTIIIYYYQDKMTNLENRDEVLAVKHSRVQQRKITIKASILKIETIEECNRRIEMYRKIIQKNKAFISRKSKYPKYKPGAKSAKVLKLRKNNRKMLNYIGLLNQQKSAIKAANPKQPNMILFRKMPVGQFNNPRELTIALNGWARMVKQQFNNRCSVCGKTNDIHAHHIKPKALYPEDALNPSNGICLCKEHHLARYEGSVHQVLGIKYTEVQFWTWFDNITKGDDL